jgi:hypothetical protein
MLEVESVVPTDLAKVADDAFCNLQIRSESLDVSRPRNPAFERLALLQLEILIVGHRLNPAGSLPFRTC